MASFNIVPIPIADPIARPADPNKRKDPAAGIITDAWVKYFTSLGQTVSQSSVRIQALSLTGQSASIGATDLSGGALSDGLYRVTYYARITRAGTVSSSLTVTIGYTDGGAAPSFSGAAMTGNTTTTVQSGTVLIHSDSASPITYATTYATAGATSMLYRLDLLLEQIAA